MPAHGLDDPAWLRQRYAVAGDAAIAAQLGVDRKTVRAARARHGIPSQPVGPRRGVARPASRPAMQAVSPFDGLTANERHLIDRYRADRKAAATTDLLVSRLRAAHDADANRDTLAYEDAMLAIATCAARIAEHSQMLRRAA